SLWCTYEKGLASHLSKLTVTAASSSSLSCAGGGAVESGADALHLQAQLVGASSMPRVARRFRQSGSLNCRRSSAGRRTEEEGAPRPPVRSKATQLPLCRRSFRRSTANHLLPSKT